MWSKGLSRVFSNTTVQKHQFFGAQLSLMVQLPHPYTTTGKTIALTIQTSVGKVTPLLFNMLSRLRKQICSCRTQHPALRCSVEVPACLRAVQWSYTHPSHCLTFILCVAAPRPRHGASQLPGSSPVGALFRPQSPWIRCHFAFG